MKIDKKHKINLQGRYNKSVGCCLDCDHSFIKDNSHGALVDNIIGFADSDYGLMAIWECPVCFSKWFYHGEEHYMYFLIAIDDETQKYFKKTDFKNEQ